MVASTTSICNLTGSPPDSRWKYISSCPFGPYYTTCTFCLPVVTIGRLCPANHGHLGHNKRWFLWWTAACHARLKQAALKIHAGTIERLPSNLRLDSLSSRRGNFDFIGAIHLVAHLPAVRFCSKRCRPEPLRHPKLHVCYNLVAAGNV